MSLARGSRESKQIKQCGWERVLRRELYVTLAEGCPHWIPHAVMATDRAPGRGLTEETTWPGHTAGFSLWDLEGGGSRWALASRSGCCWLECLLPAAARPIPFYLTAASGPQHFNAVLAHQHSDCNRLLALRGPSVLSCPPHHPAEPVSGCHFLSCSFWPRGPGGVVRKVLTRAEVEARRA